jgi:hypothetical protein
MNHNFFAIYLNLTNYFVRLGGSIIKTLNSKKIFVTLNNGSDWITVNNDSISNTDKFSFDLGENSYASGIVRARQTDKAGNTSEVSNLRQWEIDTTGPTYEKDDELDFVRIFGDDNSDSTVASFSMLLIVIVLLLVIPSFSSVPISFKCNVNVSTWLS